MATAAIAASTTTKALSSISHTDELIICDEEYWLFEAKKHNISNHFLDLEKGFQHQCNKKVKSAYKKNLETLNKTNFHKNDVIEETKRRISSEIRINKNRIQLLSSNNLQLDKLINCISPKKERVIINLFSNSKKIKKELNKSKNKHTTIKKSDINKYFEKNPIIILDQYDHEKNKKNDLTKIANSMIDKDVKLVSFINNYKFSDFELLFESGIDVIYIDGNQWINAPVGSSFAVYSKNYLPENLELENQAYASLLTIKNSIDSSKSNSLDIVNKRIRYLNQILSSSISRTKEIDSICTSKKVLLRLEGTRKELTIEKLLKNRIIAEELEEGLAFNIPPYTHINDIERISKILSKG
ncbi:hypothetical protein [Pseudoalteromonas mariniglutinosa]|uniref:hypothetical protein n=1 Tax=Pseudoalteromonas mariniglutinosa TaxID=206042 RepID=UPI00384EEEFA